MLRILSQFKLRPVPAFVVSASLLGAIALVDYVTGPDVSVFVLYMIPVGVITWFCGTRAGVLFAALSAVIAFFVMVHAKDLSPHAFPAYWNSFIRFVSLWVVARLVFASRQLRKKVEDLVAERTTELSTEIQRRKESEEAIHNLASQLSSSEDAARRKLAHDIHDTLGQTLTIIKMNLEAASQHGSQPARLRESLTLVETMIQQTKTLTFELYPAMLEHLGLTATLHQHAELMSTGGGVQVTIHEVGVPRQLPDQAGPYLFRAVKELIHNATKHGMAREVLVTLHWRAEELSIAVDDDGKGFDVGAALMPHPERGLGLAGITERLRSIGGEICIESAVGKGTRIILTLPLLREEASQPLETV